MKSPLQWHTGRGHKSRTRSGSSYWPSPYARLQRTQAGHYFLYHSLFGNAFWASQAVADLLTHSSQECLDSDLAESIETLFDCYYLLESPNEDRDITREWLADRSRQLESGQLISGLQISVSNGCNLACTYCFADSADIRGDRKERSGAKNISLDLAMRSIHHVLALARECGRETIAVKLLGREPLVNWHTIAELLAKCRHLPIHWFLTTNGTLLTPSIAKDLSVYNVTTTISVDGSEELHDGVRPQKGKGTGSYAHSMRGLRYMQETGAPYNISIVLSTAKSIPLISQWINNLADPPPREVETTLAMQTGPGQSIADADSLVDDLVTFYSTFPHSRMSLHGDWIDPFTVLVSTRHTRSDSSVRRPQGAGCSATNHQIALEPNGDLYPCRAMSSRYGNIDDLGGALRSPEYRHTVMRTYFNVPACQGCPLEGFCQGTCLGHSEQLGDIYRVDHRYCNTYRGVAQSLVGRLCPKGW